MVPVSNQQNQGQGFGPYIIMKSLGEGGMGVVYQARHKETGQLVALKTVHLSDERQLQSIRQEIHALVNIKHPGIVSILEEGMTDGIPWYAMDLLEGETLREHFFSSVAPVMTSSMHPLDTAGNSSPENGIPKDKTAHLWWTSSMSGLNFPESKQAPINTETITEEPEAFSGVAGKPILTTQERLTKVLTIIYLLCDPLAFLHGQGMVHRDLKPENIFITRNEMPVLVDFGLSTQFMRKVSREVLDTDAGSVGTVSYMSPEQIRGEYVDARADIYALGCILYELIAGHPPFLGIRTDHILRAHLAQKPQPLSKLKPDIPAELDALVLQLLAKDPQERIGYADALSTMLLRLGARKKHFSHSPPVQPYLYRPGFAGRTSLMRELWEFMDKNGSSGGGLILIGGESGVGKTRVIMELGREAAFRQYHVLTGECLENSARPLEALLKPISMIADYCRIRGVPEVDRVFGARGKVLSLYDPSLASLPGQDKYPEPDNLPVDAAKVRIFSSLAQMFEDFTDHGSLLLHSKKLFPGTNSNSLISWRISNGDKSWKNAPRIRYILCTIKYATWHTSRLIKHACPSFMKSPP
ncbi:protein kinase [candidate division CSSED10-310 bacterium]|uniref:non-specific serine/threonine protein kinase n=1 Tax=candidate division CSSED10-310 bacterium TaxID=2855610 RepID=A0ABV6Z4I4_UNCC1